MLELKTNTWFWTLQIISFDIIEGEEDDKWIEKWAYKNYPNQNVGNKVRKIWCTPYKSYWITPNDLVHIKLRIEKAEKMGQNFHYIKNYIRMFQNYWKTKKTYSKVLKSKNIMKHTIRNTIVKINLKTQAIFNFFYLTFDSHSYSVCFRMY